MQLSGNALKLFACFFMVVDHVGFLFFPEIALFRIIGRLALPLFAFLLAVGFTKTRDQKKYLQRLSLFAVVSQVPYMAFLYAAGADVWRLNIFITLALGLFALMCAQGVREKAAKVLIVCAIAIVAQVLAADYGTFGVLLIAAHHVFLQRRSLGAGAIVIFSVLYSVFAFLVNGFLWQICSLFALPLVFLYNGEKGISIPRSFFYWFYPVHLAFLTLLFYFLF